MFFLSSPERSSSEFMSWRGVQRPSTFHIFNSRMTAVIYSKLTTNVPYEVPSKCCSFLVDPKSNMAALVSDWLTCFKFLLMNGFRDLPQT